MRLLRWLLLALLVLLVLAVVVAWTLPAQLAWRVVADRAGSVQLEGISGSVWRGHADRLSVAATPVGTLDWQLQPAALLRGQLRAQLQLSGPRVQGRGQVTRLRDGRLDVRGLHLTMPAEQLQPALGLPSLQLLGTFQVDVAHALVEHVWFDALQAHAVWQDAGVAGSARAAFGAVLADVNLDDAGRVVGRLHDGGGPLMVQGRLQASPIGYTLVAHLRPRDRDNFNLQEALMYIGQRQPDGSVLLRVEGHAQLPTL